MINRHNYEEYFLLYTDNELSAGQRKSVEDFIDGNPDLRVELQQLQQVKLRPEHHIFFNDKSSLLKSPGGGLTLDDDNYQEYFLLYADNELSDEQKNAVDEFVRDHPSLRQEFELLLISQVGPDSSIVFPDKSLLYKKPERRAVRVPLVRVAVAAALVALAGLFVLWNIGKVPVVVPVRSFEDSAGAPKVVSENPRNTPAAPSGVTSSAADTLHIVKQQMPSVVINKQNSGIKHRLAHDGITTEQSTQPPTRVTNEGAADSFEPIAEVTPVQQDVEKNNTRKTTEITTPFISDRAARLVASGPSADTTADMGMVMGDEGFYIASTTPDKNRFRGFFRKVSRVFNKTAHVEKQDNDAIYIGSFRVALK